MIEIAEGNLLKAPAEALVNTVNTEGVMGKGIALQFSKAYPAMYDAYRAVCKAGQLHLGEMHVYDLGHLGGELSGHRFIINFPTKGHWRESSRLDSIAQGLKSLVDVVRELNIRSIAVPPLGCGNGGLNWQDVRPLIEEAFDSLPDVKALVYPPTGAPAAKDMPSATARPKITRARAILIKLIDRYIKGLLDPHITLLEVQKLMYFMQEAGQPLKLNFVKGTYGPYANNLRFELNRLEGHYLTGFGDGSDNPLKTLALMDGAVDEAYSKLARDDAANRRMDRLERLIDGFEDSYGLELLGTMHWVMVENPEARKNPEIAVAAVLEWSARKALMMKPSHLRTAWERLTSEDWHFDCASLENVPSVGTPRSAY